jgi:formylglycine-generating enzyme required for sulfatase activity
MGYNPSYFKATSRPVESVSWHEAAAFCNAMSIHMGLSACYTCTGSKQAVRCQVLAAHSAGIHACPGVRLPTEAEWEYTYRAGSTTAYYLGPNTTCTNVDQVLEKIGFYARNSGKSTRVVGRLQPNAWGLFDMSGNVWEWTNDWWTQELGGARVSDPAGPVTGMMRTVKGGSWGSAAGDARGASRDGVLPHRHFDSEGFRVARTGP